jgi:hypothetical protein
MSNKQPPILKRSFDDLFNNVASFRAIVERNSEALKALCLNNEYLLKSNGKSVYRQLRDIIKAHNFIISDQQYHSLADGKNKVCSTIYEWLIASYWGLTPDELRSLDTSKPCDHIKPVINV